MDESPDFDPYILPPRVVTSTRPPDGRPSVKDTLLKGVDDLLNRSLQVQETRGEIREANVEATRPDITRNEPREPEESPNVVYHQDIPPSYSEIDFPERRNK
jgi:hypothetical protein